MVEEREQMTSRRYRAVVSLTVMVMGMLTFGTAWAGDRLPLTMTVSLEESYDDAYSTEVYKLHVRLTNHQKRPISIANDHLPWLGLNDELLVPRVMTLDNPHTVIDRAGPPADLMGLTFALKPQEWLEGDIVLTNNFPTFLQEIEQHGVRIEWRCKVRDTPVICPAGEGGVFVIPKGRRR
jgi:hypothetical protein